MVREASTHERDATNHRREEKLYELGSLEGNWKQFKGNVKQQWGKLTDDQLDVIAGKRDSLAGKIQETYGISKDESEKQLSAWESKADDSWFQ